MNEDEARAVIAREFGVSRETQLAAFAKMLVDESAEQNLVARSTIAQLWQRHILDSAQLLKWAFGGVRWADIGSGAGLPGIVAAILHDGPVDLIEPRRRRADFLQHVVDRLELRNATVVPVRAERFDGRAGVITARAVAPLAKIFEMARHLATSETVWILPKGKSAQSEVDVAREAWQGVFHVEQSMTDPTSKIVIAREVRAR